MRGSSEERISNFSFEIEALNHIEMPKNYEGPLQEIKMVELPDRGCAVYREVRDSQGRIVFQRTTNALVIAQDSTPERQRDLQEKTTEKRREGVRARDAFEYRSTSAFMKINDEEDRGFQYREEQYVNRDPNEFPVPFEDNELSRM